MAIKNKVHPTNHHAQFADCFSREEPRKSFYRYMAGQMSQLERESIEPIALNVERAKVRAMQHFLSDIVWEEGRILSRYQGMVCDDLGDSDGVLIFDESGFVKKGVTLSTFPGSTAATPAEPPV